MKLKKGFTLAEVLVTLGIIGVVTSLVLPTLLHSVPNKEQIMLKKAYYLLSRNVTELINDEELYPERTSESQSGLANIYIGDQTADGGEALFHGQRYSGKSKFCNLMAARMNIKGNINCDKQVSLDKGGNFTTADGIVWSMPNSDFSKAGTVQIDVNGTSGRNCSESDAKCTIPDRFKIDVDKYGRLTVPADGIEQEYLTRSTTNVSYADIKRKTTKK